MSVSVDVRLALQRLERQGRRLTLAAISTAAEEHPPIVEDTLLRMLRTGELVVALTPDYIRVKNTVPSKWRDADNSKARINRLFGGSHSG